MSSRPLYCPEYQDLMCNIHSIHIPSNSVDMLRMNLQKLLIHNKWQYMKQALQQVMEASIATSHESKSS